MTVWSDTLQEVAAAHYVAAFIDGEGTVSAGPPDYQIRAVPRWERV